MAYRLEKNNEDYDLVIDGFEKGIADSPEAGISDMRSLNITSQPSEASVQFALQSMTLPPVLTGIAFTAQMTGDTITIASTAGFYNGMAIIINTIAAGVAGLSAVAGSNTYYVSNITATTFKVSKNLAVIGVVDITSDGNGTLSTAQLGSPYDSCIGFDSTALSTSGGQIIQDVFILDATGQVWHIGNGTNGTTLNTLQFCGNTNKTTLSTAGSLGITIFKGYLLVFIEDKIDYIKLSDLFGSTGAFGAWHIAWQSTTPSFAGHKAIAATDDAIYFCNYQVVSSLLQNASQTFDPATAATFTYNTSALSLPTIDFARSIAQLGQNLLIGGISFYIYPWDRASTSFAYPIIVAEAYIKNIVSTNSNAYVFAGNRGRIYLTNGSNIQLFKKFPDHLSGTQNPYYTWGDALYYRNQLYFSVSATTNATATISNFAGVWAIDLDTLALRLENSLSTVSYAGTVPVIVPMGNLSPGGNGLYVGYVQTTGFIDYSSTAPYTNFEAFLDTDIVPVGTFYNVKTFEQIEFKLSKPLVAGEAVRIQWRSNLNDSYTTVFTDTTAGDISGASPANFQKIQWVQLRGLLSSTATTPSYTRLREIRLR